MARTLTSVPLMRILGTSRPERIMPKTRLNLSLDQDLVDYVKLFARQNRVTVADVVTQYLLALKRRAEGEETESVLSHPAFRQAMDDVQARLQDGTAEWLTFDEVFGA